MLTDDGHAPSGTGSFSISADKSYEGLYEINENAVNVQEAGTGIDSRRTAHKSDAIQNKNLHARSDSLQSTDRATLKQCM